MKKIFSCLILLSLLSPFFLSAQSASLLGEGIYSDLLNLQILIDELNSRLQKVDVSLSRSEQSVTDLERLGIEKDRLLAELQTLLDRREWTLGQLNLLVEEQRTAYKKSLFKWKFSTVTLAISSAGLLGIVMYQGVSR